MTSLVEIIARLINNRARAAQTLPRGLWLVAYPADGDQPARLIAGRKIATPSTNELSTVREALLEALDRHPTQVVVHMTGWHEVDWQKTEVGDWNGYQIAWRMSPVTDAFSHDRDRADAIRRALDHRDQRILNRPATRPPRRSAAKPRPMF